MMAGVSTSAGPEPHPAATAIVVRSTDDGFEVLLLRRSDVGAFAGLWVFPGGRVDDGDPGDDELSRAASAAVREVGEEVGITVDAGQMTVWSHWTPPAIAPKRYATWFFVAPFDDDADVLVDGHEILEHRWLRPAQALAAGLPMAPPTIVTLHELAAAGSLAQLAQRGDPPAYLTRAAQTADGTAVLLWAGDAGYESGDPDQAGPRNRLWMFDGLSGSTNRYERSG